jgi:hypothetical protein
MEKLKYEKARIEVCELEKKDVLMSSSSVEIPIEPPIEEEQNPFIRENSYVSFFDLSF